MQKKTNEQITLIDPVELEMYIARGRQLRAQAMRAYGRQVIAFFGKGAEGVASLVRRMFAGSAPAR